MTGDCCILKFFWLYANGKHLMRFPIENVVFQFLWRIVNRALVSLFSPCRSPYSVQSLQGIIVNLPGWCGPPQCKPDGSFEEIQCCASTGKCRCIDREGKKVEGTEQHGKPDCKGKTLK